MADGKLIFVAGASSVIGAVATAIGHAFGFNRRMTMLEAEMDALKTTREEYVTKPYCNEKIDATEKIVDLQFGRHTEQIADLKASQEKGFSAIVDKLDRIIAKNI